jgi:hypothetical protein
MKLDNWIELSYDQQWYLKGELKAMRDTGFRP